MSLASPEFAVLIVGALVAGFVQGLSGFAFSMVAMSVWVWMLEPRLAAVMAVFGSLTGQVIGLFSVKRALSLADLAPFLLGGLVGIPLGVGVLPHLDANAFKLGLGLLLVVTCPLMLAAADLPRIELRSTALRRACDGMAGAAGGFMGGIGGFTGVIPTLWCTLRGMDKASQRGVVQNFNLAALTVTMIGYVASGAVTQPMWSLMPLVALAVVLPSLAGVRVYHALNDRDFRRVVLGLLTASGAVMLIAAVPRLIA